MFLNLYFCFQPNFYFFCLASNFILTPSDQIILFFSRRPSPVFILPHLRHASSLTLLHTPVQNFLKAIAHMEDFYYFCIGNGRKGPISRMSDECLIRLETVFSYCYDCQAVMRKFTLAHKTKAFILSNYGIKVFFRER